MSELQYIRAEFLKAKHSTWIWMHMLLPVLALVVISFYYRNYSQNKEFMASMYAALLSCVFPIGIAVMSAKCMGWEEESHFQHMLMDPSRLRVLLAKFIALYLMGTLTTLIAVIPFCYLILRSGSVVFLVELIVSLLLPNFILYLFHIFLALRFGKAVSVIVGVVGSMTGLLMMTALGDRIWQWIPYCISVRMSGYFTLLSFHDNSFDETLLYMAESTKAALPMLIWGIGMLLFISIWFGKWEGRTTNE